MTGTNVRILVLLSALSLYCDFSATAFAGPPNMTPCFVLTNSDVEQVLGKLAGNPKQDSERNAAWCNYEFANGKDAMEVWIFPADGIERGRKQAKKPVPVKGVGQEAFLDRGTQDLNSVNLFVRKAR